MTYARVVAILALLPAALLANDVTRARYLMGTTCEVSVAESPRADEQIAAAFDEASRIEAMLSTWRDTSELARVNRGEVSRPSRELYALLVDVTEQARATGGAFDPLIRPLLDAWDTRGNGRVPSDGERHDALLRASIDNVSFVDGEIALRNGAAFEEGGFGKGYAIDRMLAVLRARGATSALINFGGQLAAFGAPRDVTIAHPEHRDVPRHTLTLTNESLSTSSGSEKTFVVDGRRITHILDPRDGNALPPRGSVSVLHASALTADVLSTALYVMGAEAGIRWARAHDVAAIFISPAGEITQTKKD